MMKKNNELKQENHIEEKEEMEQIIESDDEDLSNVVTGKKRPRNYNYDLPRKKRKYEIRNQNDMNVFKYLKDITKGSPSNIKFQMKKSNQKIINEFGKVLGENEELREKNRQQEETLNEMTEEITELVQLFNSSNVKNLGDIINEIQDPITTLQIENPTIGLFSEIKRGPRGEQDVDLSTCGHISSKQSFQTNVNGPTLYRCPFCRSHFNFLMELRDALKLLPYSVSMKNIK